MTVGEEQRMADGRRRDNGATDSPVTVSKDVKEALVVST